MSFDVALFWLLTIQESILLAQFLVVLRKYFQSRWCVFIANMLCKPRVKTKMTEQGCCVAPTLCFPSAMMLTALKAHPKKWVTDDLSILPSTKKHSIISFLEVSIACSTFDNLWILESPWCLCSDHYHILLSALLDSSQFCILMSPSSSAYVAITLISSCPSFLILQNSISLCHHSPPPLPTTSIDVDAQPSTALSYVSGLCFSRESSFPPWFSWAFLCWSSALPGSMCPPAQQTSITIW